MLDTVGSATNHQSANFLCIFAGKNNRVAVAVGLGTERRWLIEVDRQR